MQPNKHLKEKKKKKNWIVLWIFLSLAILSLSYSAILFYTLLAFVRYWQFLKIKCEKEEESSRLSPMDNSDKWWRITIFWVIALHHCEETVWWGKKKQKLLFTMKTAPQWILHVDNPSYPSPLGFVWGEQPTNAATAPAKWKSHLTINYSHLT